MKRPGFEQQSEMLSGLADLRQRAKVMQPFLPALPERDGVEISPPVHRLSF